MGLLFIKGLIIGIIFCAPIGAIGALTFRRTLRYGFGVGFISGLGSTLADSLYALAGGLFATVIQGLLQKWLMPLSLLGGCIIAVFGMIVIIKKEEKTDEKLESGKLTGMFLSSFVVGIFNPVTVLGFIAVFSFWNVEIGKSAYRAAALVAGVAAGTCVWWLILCGITQKIRSNIAEKAYEKIQKIMGVLLVIFGIIIVINGFR